MTAAYVMDPSTPKRKHQLLLEELFDKNQLVHRVRQAFKDYEKIKFAELIGKAALPLEFGFDLLTQMAVHKRATVPTIVGCLRHHFQHDQATADAVERAVDAGLAAYSAREGLLVVVYGVSPALQEELDRFQYPLPMVVPPREVASNLETGYLTGKGSVILRDNHHDDDVCLDHLNRVNRVKLALNLDTARTIQNRWRGLDRKRKDETWEDYKKRRKAFEKYDSVAKDVIGLLVREGNELYLTHRYDKRGRTYCMGHHVTYQGTDWNKAVLEFAEKEPVND